jgi:TrmH family RNA methyltransferase
MERISSRQNPIVRRFRALSQGSTEDLLLDGAHLLEEALASDLPIEVVAIHDALADGPLGRLAERAERTGARLIAVSESVMGALSPVRQPSGIVAIAGRRAVPLERALDDPPQMVMMLAAVQDPGNVGAIIRAAEACGATGVITAEGTADPFGWKAIRGSMGSIFRVRVATRQPLDAAVEAARARGVHIYAAVPAGGVPLCECNLRGATAVLLGGEGPGLAAHLVDLADRTLSIPMRPPVESLNVATAAAIILYEAHRQRHGGCS